MFKKSIPNLLSIGRVLISPLFITSISNGWKILSGTIIFFGAVSDFFDGYLARKFNAVSKIGKLLDPLADKMFSNFVLWGIYIYNGRSFIILLVAILLTLKDLMLLFTSIYGMLTNKKFDVSPLYISKICTSLIFLLAFLSVFLKEDSKILNTLGTASILLTIITGIAYYKRLKETASH
jgi:cardiolipin synthase